MISEFSGEYRWLSNFAPVEIHYDGAKYPSVENAYVAAKTLNKGLREPLEVMTSGQAKKYGKTLALRSDWEMVKVAKMKNFLYQKFLFKEYQEKLLATGESKIIEGNTWHDNFWGSCVCDLCGDKGNNKLGKLLMALRRELRENPPMFLA